MDSFKTLQDEISKALVSTTRSATRIANADIGFQRSLNPALGPQLDAQNARLLQLAQRLLKNAAASSDAVGLKLPDTEAVDANWRGIVDVIDSLLEKADSSLDEYTGVVKRLNPVAEQGATVARPNVSEKRHIAKPQLAFEYAPFNYESGGFRPLLTSKPHSIIPLDQCLKTFQDSRDREQYPHPYQTEIESYEYPSFVSEVSEPQHYLPFETTTATFVDTPEALTTMLAELKMAKEIAIDIEHHDNRSYVGMVSLMQISTRDKDWIVDTLKPWRRKLECLNEVFTDPHILKVLHGAYMDIIWLQRDLGLYIVGLFDTHHASRSLGYPGGSLAYLLERFVQFKAQKQYQLADWRTRPLSKELFEYARADTHFLLYVYDNMRNELVEKSDFSDPERNKVLHVLLKSKETALQRYEHHVYDFEYGSGSLGWYKTYIKAPAQLSQQQFAVFRAVHRWRDNVARQQDDSPFYIMPNHAILSIARAMPSDRPNLLSLVPHMSPVLREKVDELLGVIGEGRRSGIDGPELQDVLKTILDRKNAAFEQKLQSATVPSTVVKDQQPAPTQEINRSITASPAVRTPQSRFWGSLWQGESGSQRRSISTLSIELAVPLPPLTAEIFTNDHTADESEPSEASKPQHNFVPKEDRPPPDERTDTFVVKHLRGQKRKREEATANGTISLDPMLQDEVLLESDSEVEQKSKSKIKAEKKAARRARKRELAAVSNGADEPAFDYANAPSVMHANADDGKRDKKDKKGKKKAKGFDAFAGLGAGPKGLPKKQKEGAGRSKTFKK